MTARTLIIEALGDLNLRNADANRKARRALSTDLAKGDNSLLWEHDHDWADVLCLMVEFWYAAENPYDNAHVRTSVRKHLERGLKI